MRAAASSIADIRSTTVGEALMLMPFDANASFRNLTNPLMIPFWYST